LFDRTANDGLTPSMQRKGLCLDFFPTPVNVPALPFLCNTLHTFQEDRKKTSAFMGFSLANEVLSK
jgi:hypothetical protein